MHQNTDQHAEEDDAADAQEEAKARALLSNHETGGPPVRIVHRKGNRAQRRKAMHDKRARKKARARAARTQAERGSAPRWLYGTPPHKE